jgi:DNA-directed RNA polymerase subunit RPC12/RpoP
MGTIAATYVLAFANPLAAFGFSALEVITKSGLFLCGNMFCRNFITVKETDEIPYVCENCGKEINWVGILTKIAKECPQCKKRYFGFPNYCRHHRPAVALKEIEIRI